jgi:hypothetical protein
MTSGAWPTCEARGTGDAELTAALSLTVASVVRALTVLSQRSSMSVS